MPYVQGESLRDQLERERQLPIDQALHITRDVAAALGYAHATRRSASRHQAREHPAVRRPGGRGGLRYRTSAFRRGRRAADGDRARAGHTALYESRAGSRRGSRRRPCGHLRPRVRSVRDARRRAALYRANRPGDHRQTHAGAGTPDTNRQGERSSGAGACHHPVAGQDAGRPVRHRARVRGRSLPNDGQRAGAWLEWYGPSLANRGNAGRRSGRGRSCPSSLVGAIQSGRQSFSVTHRSPAIHAERVRYRAFPVGARPGVYAERRAGRPGRHPCGGRPHRACPFETGRPLLSRRRSGAGPPVRRGQHRAWQSRARRRRCAPGLRAALDRQQRHPTGSRIGLRSIRFSRCAHRLRRPRSPATDLDSGICPYS